VIASRLQILKAVSTAVGASSMGDGVHGSSCESVSEGNSRPAHSLVHGECKW